VTCDPSGREFNRQRHPIELSADAGHDRGVRGVKVETGAARRGAFQEQLDRWEALRCRHREIRVVRRVCQGRKPVDVLALDMKRFAARRQDVSLAHIRIDAGSQLCGRIDDVLAGVEDQEGSPVRQVGDETREGVVGLERQAQHRGHGRRDETGIAYRAEIDEMHSACKRLDQIMPHRHCNCGLADPARADDGDEARGGQLSRERGSVIGPPDHAGQTTRQVGVRIADRDLCTRVAPPARSRHRRHKAITSSGKSGDVAGAVLAVSQRPSQVGDMKPQTAFLNRDVWPDQRQQIHLADNFVRTRGQTRQDVEGARSQIDRRALPQEKPLVSNERKRTKCYLFAHRRRWPSQMSSFAAAWGP